MVLTTFSATVFVFTMVTLNDKFYTPDDLQVMDLDQIYMTSSAYLATGFKDVWATFDLLVRDMPKHRNFMVFTGLEEMIRGIMGWRYTRRHVALLRRHKLISKEFGKYLLDFKFSGTVYGMKEGTVFFPGEPVLRVTAPIIEANLLTAFLITSLSSNTPYATKYARVVLAAAGQYNVTGTSPNRANSFEHAFKAQRSSYIVGSANSPSPALREKLGIPMGDASTNAYHAFIKSYPTELEAMRAAVDHAKVEVSLMIDTYNLKQGLKNAIRVIKEFQVQKKTVKVIIDSGDLAKEARYVRKELDRRGLTQIRITLAGNLDEYKIAKLVQEGVPVNTCIVATEAQTSSDDPKLEAVYKLSEIIRGREVEPKMKLSPGKISLPGRKQVFRILRQGQFDHDVIGLQGERLGITLLQPMIIKGRQIYQLPHVQKIRAYVAAQLKQLPSRLKEITQEHYYKVTVSPRLKRLIQKVRAEHLAQYQDLQDF